MRLHEIIVESDWDDVADLSRSNVSQGADTVNKILSPSRWFEKGKGGNDAAATSTPAASAPAHLNKEALMTAASGKQLLPQDAAKLKALATQVSTEKLKPINLDNMQLFMALKMAYQGKPLNDDQKQLLIAFSKQL
jgi:hypothetical protein